MNMYAAVFHASRPLYDMSDSKKPPKPRRAPPKKLDANEEEDMSGEYIVTSPIVLKRLNKGCSNLMYSCEMGKATDVEQDLKLAVSVILSTLLPIMMRIPKHRAEPDTQKERCWYSRAA